jgi:hypothetical protein
MHNEMYARNTNIICSLLDGAGNLRVETVLGINDRGGLL